MKILIINLPRYQGTSVTREGRCELLMDYRIDTPATLLILAAQLRQKNSQIDFIDANGLNLNYQKLTQLLKRKKFDCVIFTIASIIIDYDLIICDIVKDLNPFCITIGYSWYAKKYCKEILTEYKNLDILIIEDPFSVIKDLFNCLDKKENLKNVQGIAYRDNENQISFNPELKTRIKFRELPLPAYDLLKTFKPYYIYTPLLRPYALVYAGKGCPFRCRYCNVANTKYSGRSAQQIIEELKVLRKLGKVKYVWFFDEIFTINRKRTLEICQAMIKENLKIKWLCDSRVDIIDKDMLKIMKKAGCIGISYGVESGSQAILNSMNKGITVKQAKEAIKWTRKAHIPIQLNMILGYMGENVKTIQENKNFIKVTFPEILQVTKMMFLEDTEFSNIAFEKGWINKEIEWKNSLIKPKSKVINYEPFKLNLFEESKKMQKMLYYNPKWWINCLKTLVYNNYLIYPLIATLLSRIYKKNVI